MPSGKRILRDPQDSGTAQMVSFLIAGVLFVATIGAVLFVARQTGRPSIHPADAQQQAAAERIADLLVKSPGIGWAGGADHLQRLGLAATNGSGLSQSSLDSLRGAMMASTANNLVDYADAQQGLGISPTGTEGFHIRMAPKGLLATERYADLSNLRTAYIGDWTALVTVTVPSGSNAQMESSANAGLNLTMMSNVAKERQALRDLHLGFYDRVYITTTGPATILVSQPFPLPAIPLLTVEGKSLIEGDVYPDVKQYLNDVLPGRLAQYDVIVVGSGVDQSTLTSNAVKDAIATWVINGGMLVVMGSANQNYQWLQPLFSVGVSTVNGAPTAPDPSSPILTDPHALNWMQYNDHGMAWDIKSTGANNAYDAFNHVIVQGGKDVLAVSKDGGFGAGRVTLTTYLGTEVAASLGQTEAENFIANVILYSDRHGLYLEYGPQAPTDQPVSVAVRDSYVWDSKLGQVPVEIQVAVWGAK